MLLSYTWQWYAEFFANQEISDYVLGVVHQHLERLDWSLFIPLRQDLEMMVRVVDRFLSSCHCFLSKIFVRISWQSLQKQLDANTLSMLFKLIVKLSAEVELRKVRERLSRNPNLSVVH